MARRFAIFTMAAVALGLGAPIAYAGNGCIKAAKAEYRECGADCKEAYQVAKDACLNRDHECVDICRAYRAVCIDATGLEAALDVCGDDRETAIANCKALYGPDTPERDQCIDNAQVEAFQCRDLARETYRPAVKLCRKGFTACAKACPPGAGPVEDPKACKLAAKGTYKTCRTDCREDFQVAKDACFNRDHDCVETCRSQRQTCKDPVLATRDAAIDACNTTRAQAIAACNGDDTCIDQAQVVAFQCRDQAREDARPGLQACRAAFKTCVTACPPQS